MESKFKDPGKRILQLAVRDAISSKLSLNSSVKRELDKNKQCRRKINVGKESLVTEEMAEIFKSMKKEKVVNGCNSKTNLCDKPSKIEKKEKNITLRSMSVPSLSRTNFKANVQNLFNDSDKTLKTESSPELQKSVSSEYMPSTNWLDEDHPFESVIINGNAKKEFYIPPPHYPDSFLVSTSPAIFPENTINSHEEDKKNNFTVTSPDQFQQHFSHANICFNPENEKQCLDLNESYKFSPPNLMSYGANPFASNNPERISMEESLQNSQSLFWKTNKSNNKMFKYQQLSPKKNEKYEYIDNLIDSIIYNKCGSSSTEVINNCNHKEQHILAAPKAENEVYHVSISPSDKASRNKEQHILAAGKTEDTVFNNSISPSDKESKNKEQYISPTQKAEDTVFNNSVFPSDKAYKNQEQYTSTSQKAEDAVLNISTANSSFDKASMYKSLNKCDTPTKCLNLQRNVCKNEENIIEEDISNLTENNSIPSSHNRISVAVLCEFLKLHAMLN